MALTYEQAKAAEESLADVFVPRTGTVVEALCIGGDAGIIVRTHTHAFPDALVELRDGTRLWIPLRSLNTAETLPSHHYSRHRARRRP